jgi:PhnB protein
MAAKPIPDGYHTVTPYLTVRDAAKVIDFLKQAFRAGSTHEPIKRPDGRSCMRSSRSATPAS